jgi:hypothetical protein
MSNRIWSIMMKAAYATLLAILMFSLTGGFPTRVLASCYGKTCDGKGPVANGCSGVTKKSLDLSTTGSSYPGLDELRYASNCNAEWARVTNQGCCWWYMGATAWSYENYSYSQQGGGIPGQSIYTPMVSHVTETGANNPGKACAKVWGDPVSVPISKSSGLCTGWW